MKAQLHAHRVCLQVAHQCSCLCISTQWSQWEFCYCHYWKRVNSWSCAGEPLLSREVDFHIFSALWLNTPSLANSSALKEHINHIGLFRTKRRKKISLKYPMREMVLQVLKTAELTVSLCTSLSWGNSRSAACGACGISVTQQCHLTPVKVYREFLCSDIFPVIFATFRENIC